VLALLDSLPEEAKKAFVLAIMRGVPSAQALQQIVQAVQAQSGGAAQPQSGEG
jgi:hypothetical protein